MDANRTYRNYLFDLYGTLVDIHTDEQDLRLWDKLRLYLAMKGAAYTQAELRNTYFRLVKAAEKKARGEIGPWAEIDIAPVLKAVFSNKGVPATDLEIEDLAKFFRVLSIHKLKLFPNVIKLLDALRARGCRIYLLSNAQRLFTQPELQMLGLLPYFDGIVLSSDEGIKKPDHALYHRTLERYHLDPKETVMVGNDDIADSHGAANAGLDSIYIYTEQSPRRTKPLPENCRQIKNIGSLLDLL